MEPLGSAKPGRRGFRSGGRQSLISLMAGDLTTVERQVDPLLRKIDSTCLILCAPPKRDGALIPSWRNDMIRTIRLLLVGAIIAASCAATAQTLRVRGTIEKADGNVLTLKSSDGAGLKLTLTDDARIVAVVRASMADIKEGTFLGSAAMPQPDGSQKALEVHIFPEQMRGTGEGHRPYAPVPTAT